MIINSNKPLKKIKAIIYDLDATLLDTEPYWFIADKRMLQEYGINFTKELKNQYIGVSIGDMLNDLKRKYPLDESFDVLRDKKNSYYLDVALGNVEMFPEMEEFYSIIREKNYKTAIASGTAYEVIIKQVQELGIIDDFEFIISADHIKNGKPAPDIYIESAKRLNLKPDQILVLEDSYHGVRAAKDAGMYCAAIPYYADSENRSPLHKDFFLADVMFNEGMETFSADHLIDWIEQ